MKGEWRCVERNKRNPAGLEPAGAALTHGDALLCLQLTLNTRRF